MQVSPVISPARGGIAHLVGRELDRVARLSWRLRPFRALSALARTSLCLTFVTSKPCPRPMVRIQAVKLSFNSSRPDRPWRKLSLVQILSMPPLPRPDGLGGPSCSAPPHPSCRVLPQRRPRLPGCTPRTIDRPKDDIRLGYAPFHPVYALFLDRVFRASQSGGIDEPEFYPFHMDSLLEEVALVPGNGVTMARSLMARALEARFTHVCPSDYSTSSPCLIARPS